MSFVDCVHFNFLRCSKLDEARVGESSWKWFSHQRRFIHSSWWFDPRYNGGTNDAVESLQQRLLSRGQAAWNGSATRLWNEGGRQVWLQLQCKKIQRDLFSFNLSRLFTFKTSATRWTFGHISYLMTLQLFISSLQTSRCQSKSFLITKVLMTNSPFGMIQNRLSDVIGSGCFWPWGILTFIIKLAGKGTERSTVNLYRFESIINIKFIRESIRGTHCWH